MASSSGMQLPAGVSTWLGGGGNSPSRNNGSGSGNGNESRRRVSVSERPLLGVTVDRSSFDDHDFHHQGSGINSRNNNNNSNNHTITSDGPKRILKSGRVKRRLKWKPASSSSGSSRRREYRNKTPVDDAASVSNMSSPSQHTFQSTATPVQSNVTPARRFGYRFRGSSGDSVQASVNTSMDSTRVSVGGYNESSDMSNPDDDGGGGENSSYNDFSLWSDDNSSVEIRSQHSHQSEAVQQIIQERTSPRRHNTIESEGAMLQMSRHTTRRQNQQQSPRLHATIVEETEEDKEEDHDQHDEELHIINTQMNEWTNKRVTDLNPSKPKQQRKQRVPSPPPSPPPALKTNMAKRRTMSHPPARSPPVVSGYAIFDPFTGGDDDYSNSIREKPISSSSRATPQRSSPPLSSLLPPRPISPGWTARSKSPNWMEDWFKDIASSLTSPPPTSSSSQQSQESHDVVSQAVSYESGESDDRSPMPSHPPMDESSPHRKPPHVKAPLVTPTPPTNPMPGSDLKVVSPEDEDRGVGLFLLASRARSSSPTQNPTPEQVTTTTATAAASEPLQSNVVTPGKEGRPPLSPMVSSTDRLFHASPLSMQSTTSNGEEEEQQHLLIAPNQSTTPVHVSFSPSSAAPTTGTKNGKEKMSGAANLNAMFKVSGLLTGKHSSYNKSAQSSTTSTSGKAGDQLSSRAIHSSSRLSHDPSSEEGLRFVRDDDDDDNSISSEDEDFGKNGVERKITVRSSNGRKERHSSTGGKKSPSNSVDSIRKGGAFNTGPVDMDSGQFLAAEHHLKAIHDMAAEHLDHEEYDEALEVFEEILRGQQQRYGEKHHRVGTALHNIGIVHLRSGNFAYASKASSQAVKVRKQALGPDHPDVAVSLAQLGVSHLECSQHKDALVAFREALKIRRKCLGPRHPKVGKLLNNIGCSLFELNELKGAKIAFEEALIIQRTMMRTTSPVNSVTVEAPNQVLLSIASTLCNIGSIKLRWGEFEEAILALEEALLLQQSVLGDEDPTVLNTVESIDFVDRARIAHEEHLFEEEFGGCSSINGGGSLPGCTGLSDNAGPAVTRMMNINIGLMQNMGFSNRKGNKSVKHRQANDDGTGQDLHWI